MEKTAGRIGGVRQLKTGWLKSDGALAPAEPWAPIINKSALARRATFMGMIGFPALALLLLLGLTTDVGRAQGTIPSGTFQFTTGGLTNGANGGSSVVTVVRVGGANGRVEVPYTGVTNSPPGTTNGVLVFDDYQMSASIKVPKGAGSVTLGTPVLDPLESPDLAPPALGTTAALSTTIATEPTSTNSVYEFESSEYQVDASAGNAVITVSRTLNGPPDTGGSVDWTINTGGTLSAGSDYAQAGVDFGGPTSGTVTFSAGDTNETITIPILDSGSGFNKDLTLVLSNPSTSPPSGQGLIGGVGQTTVTIVADSSGTLASVLPAGAVDPSWNKDNMNDSTPPFLKYPGTQGGVSGTANGNGGTVYAVVEQPDGNAIIAGNFNSYDSNPYNRIVRVLSNGYQDPTFLVAPNSGANDVINAMALQPDGKIIIGGNFTAFNGANRHGIARLNSDGSVDTTFNPGTGADGQVLALALQANGQIVIAGSFSTVNGINLASVARLNADGSVDATFNPGTGPDGVVNAVVVDPFGRVVIGGDFDTVSGSKYGGVARLNLDGSLDTNFLSGIGTYNPDSGSTDPVYALAIQGNSVLVGGAFSYMELARYNGIVQLDANGLVDRTFNPGSSTNNGTFNPLTGQADAVYAITIQPDGNILIGGDFTTYNQTRRVGIARIFPYGSLDTSFMDTAYNQFAGLINHYHNPNAVNPSDYPSGNNRNFVTSIAVETGTENVIIGGDFLRVGGGTAAHSGMYVMPTNSGIFNVSRMDIHPRSNVARLIGGSTPGPGNISLSYSSYSVDKSAGTLYVSLVRTNGSLGAISALCSPEYETPGPGIATTNDVQGGTNATWPTIVSTGGAGSAIAGTFGPNYTYDATYGTKAPGTYPDVYFTIYNDTNITGNLSAGINLTDPDGSTFMLGGEPIPLGAALGYYDSAPLTIIDNNIQPGVFGFASPAYLVNQGSTGTITVTRAGGSDNTVQINYIATNGTAVSPANFTAVSGVLTFGPGVTSQTFKVRTSSGSTTNSDRTVNLQLYGATGGAIITQSNAVLTIVNNSFAAGHIAFTATNFSVNEAAGTASVTLNRLGGSVGTLDVTVIAAGGTADNGLNYIASTNELQWNNNDISVKTITIPVLHDGIFTSNLTVNLTLTNGLLNTVANGPILGLSSITNATLTISNVDFPGTVQFSSGVYSVKKYAGYALVPVTRTGGTAQTVTVNFETQDGSATAGVNFVATNCVLTFTNGQAVEYLQIPIIDDGRPDGPLALNLALTYATPELSLGSPSNAVLNIIDTDSLNEPPGTPDSTFSAFDGFNGNINALALQPNNQLLVGGNFTIADGVPRQSLARLNSDGSLDAGFLLPSASSGAGGLIYALAIQTDGRIIAGGSFSNFNSVVENGIVRLNYDGSLDTTFNPGSGADNPVFALAQSPVDGKILVGGAFATLDGTTFNGIGRLNVDGTPDTSFNAGGLGIGSPESSLAVYAVAVQSDGKIIIGGDFTTYNGVPASHLARLNTDGSLDATFNAGTGASGPVRAIAIQPGGNILIAGQFTSYNGIALNHVARLNTDGSVDGGFTPGTGANDTVSSLALQADGRIVLGGQFTLCDGVTRNRVTRLNDDGTIDSTINFGGGANDVVNAVVIEEDTVPGYSTNVPDEKIIMGGAFTQYNGVPQAHLARAFGGSESGSGAFQFSAANYVVNEDGTNVVIAVQRIGGTSGTNADNSGDVFVPFATSDGSAVAGINYSSVITNIDFPAGEVVEYVTIPVFDDGVVTTNLTAGLALGAPFTAGAIGNQPTASLTIINDDSTISFSSANFSVPKNVASGVAGINVFRNGTSYGTATVKFATTTSGTAVSGTDYTPVTQSLVFAPGVSNLTVDVPITNNNISEGNRTIGLSLTGISGSLPVAPTNAVLTIIDTVNGPGQFVFSPASYTVTEGGGVGYETVLVTVVRTNGATGTISVNYNTVNGTAVSGVKYVATNGVLNFAGGQSSQSFAVSIINTATTEGTEHFTVALSNPTGGANFAGSTNATITIVNTNCDIAFHSATSSFLEPSNSIPGTVSLQVVRTANTSGTSTVNYSTTNGTAVAGVNFVGVTNGAVTFAPGISTTNIILQTLYDRPYAGGDLSFTVGLASQSPGVFVTSPATTTVIDHNVNAVLSFLAASNSVYANAGSVPVYVVCGNTNGVPVSVGYTTVDGTAIAGGDYTATSGTLTFTKTQLTNVFYVPILSGTLSLSNKSFNVVLSQPNSAAVLVYPTNEVITVLRTNVVNGPSLTWLGEDTNWDHVTFNWTQNGAASAYGDGDNVFFNDSTFSSMVVIAGTVAPGSVTFANLNTNYTLSGGQITGATRLTKSNGGVVSLLNGNLYTGGTLIDGGLLLVNNTNGSGTGKGAVIVAGGTLGGTGLIAGPVTVAAGGGFAPGNPSGTLTISNNLTLEAGATSYFQIQHSSPANNFSLISGTLTEGGTLVVTNTGAAALAVGDSFTLFSAGNYSGAFAGLELPPLTSGLGWNSSILNTSGVLTVVVVPPVISSVAVSQGALVFQGSSGVPGANFYLLGSTNLAAPMTNWIPVLTNTFDNNGNFDFTNLLNTNGPQSFFRLEAP